MLQHRSRVVCSVASEVERALELQEGAIAGKGKDRTTALARAIVCWCCRQLTPQPTLQEIAIALSQYGHATVLAAARRVERRREVDPGLRELSDTILARVRSQRAAHVAGVQQQVAVAS